MIRGFSLSLVKFFPLALCSMVTLASAQGRGTPPGLTSISALPSLEAIKSCMTSRESAACLDHLFRRALQSHSTLELLQLIRHFEAEDPDTRRDCHPIVHAIGRETFYRNGTIHASFSACDQTCHSGCYHGAVERFLRGDDLYSQVDRHPSQAELKKKAATACDSNVPARLRFQCLHGLGHALLYFSRYQLIPSLEACDALPEDWSQSSCYGGVFMENVSNATPERRDLNATDYHYPCNKVSTKYRSECYMMQTSRMTEMGLSTAILFEECRKAGPYHNPCALSIGRDLSNEVRAGGSRAVAGACESVTGESRLYCTRGVIYALIDNTWDGRYALPFCAAFRDETDRRNCLAESFQYLKSTFEKSADEIVKDCRRHLSPSELCLEPTLP